MLVAFFGKDKNSGDHRLKELLSDIFSFRNAVNVNVIEHVLKSVNQRIGEFGYQDCVFDSGDSWGKFSEKLKTVKGKIDKEENKTPEKIKEMKKYLELFSLVSEDYMFEAPKTEKIIESLKKGRRRFFWGY